MATRFSNREEQGPTFGEAVAQGLDKPTVFLVDPDRSTHAKVRGVASTMYVDCEGFETGQEFVDHYTHDRAGCVVLEVRTPTIGGLEIQEMLALKIPSPSVVFLTAYGTISIAVRAMRAGAVQFLEKPIRENELWEAMREALRVDAATRSAWLKRRGIESRLETLSANERRVLGMIAEGKTKPSMAADLAASIRTVEHHQSRLKNKLGLKNAAQLVHFAVVAGLTERFPLPGAGPSQATSMPPPPWLRMTYFAGESREPVMLHSGPLKWKTTP